MSIAIISFFVIALGCLTNGLPSHQGRDTRIVGGTEAPEKYSPHMAGLLFGTHVSVFVCGGTIVSTWHVLTAAHCIEPMAIGPILISSFRGVAGTNTWLSTDHVITFRGYINHPQWNSQLIKNDIGVLFLSKELVLHEKIAVMPLEFNWVGGDEDSYVVGWGLTEPRYNGVMTSELPFIDTINSSPSSSQNFGIQPSSQIPENLQLLYVRTMSHEACERAMADAPTTIPLPFISRNVEICTFHSEGHGMCNGDSGSALVSKTTGKQIGIVSWGVPCAIGAPDVFARISGFQNFLKPILSRKILVD